MLAPPWHCVLCGAADQKYHPSCRRTLALRLQSGRADAHLHRIVQVIFAAGAKVPGTRMRTALRPGQLTRRDHGPDPQPVRQTCTGLTSCSNRCAARRVCAQGLTADKRDWACSRIASRSWLAWSPFSMVKAPSALASTLRMAVVPETTSSAILMRCSRLSSSKNTLVR